MDEDTEFVVLLTRGMDGRGLEVNIMALLRQHQVEFGCEAEIVYVNPEDLAEFMAKEKLVSSQPDPTQEKLFLFGVRIVPNISTQPGHLYAGVKRSRTVGHE